MIFGVSVYFVHGAFHNSPISENLANLKVSVNLDDKKYFV